MKNNKGKITHFYSKPTQKELEKEEMFDRKFREELLKEAEEEADRIEQLPKMEGLEDPEKEQELLASIIGQLKQNGLWEEEEDDYTEEVSGQSENTEVEFSEELEHAVTAEAAAELSQEELLNLLSKENQIALKRGRHALAQDEKWRVRIKKMKKAVVSAAVVIVLFAGIMSSEANREHVMKVVTNVTEWGQNISISKDADGEEVLAQEDKDAALIQEKLGIAAPRLLYKPEGMTYDSCEINQTLRTAKIHFDFDNENWFHIQAAKGTSDAGEMVVLDGEILEQFEVYVEAIEKSIVVQKLEEQGEEMYRTDVWHDGAYYIFYGKMERIEFENTMKKIFF